jgi:MYXO-CTERM domain-containing protein
MTEVGARYCTRRPLDSSPWARSWPWHLRSTRPCSSLRAWPSCSCATGPRAGMDRHHLGSHRPVPSRPRSTLAVSLALRPQRPGLAGLNIAGVRDWFACTCSTASPLLLASRDGTPRFSQRWKRPSALGPARWRRSCRSLSMAASWPSSFTPTPRLRSTTLRERAVLAPTATTVELAEAWGVLGLAAYTARSRRRQSGA